MVDQDDLDHEIRRVQAEAQRVVVLAVRTMADEVPVCREDYCAAKAQVVPELPVLLGAPARNEPEISIQSIGPDSTVECVL